MRIEKGPFAGTEIPDAELSYIPNADGTSVPFWATHHRTPIFLERFKIEDGWQVIVETNPGGFDLPDTRQMSATPLVQPTQLFVAKLSKGGVVHAQASTLAIIDGPSAWERGETTARGRLYEASGLPGFLRAENMGDLPKAQPQAAATKTVIPVDIQPIPVESSSRSSRQDEEQTQPVSVPVQPQLSEQSQEASVDAVVDTRPAPEAEQVQAVSTVVQMPQREDVLGKGNIAKNVDGNLREQIILLAEAGRFRIPVIADNAAAKAFYKRLLQNDVQLEKAS
jgi:hypothetical protein